MPLLPGLGGGSGDASSPSLDSVALEPPPFVISTAARCGRRRARRSTGESPGWALRTASNFVSSTAQRGRTVLQLRQTACPAVWLWAAEGGIGGGREWTCAVLGQAALRTSRDGPFQRAPSDGIGAVPARRFLISDEMPAQRAEAPRQRERRRASTTPMCVRETYEPVNPRTSPLSRAGVAGGSGGRPADLLRCARPYAACRDSSSAVTVQRLDRCW